MKYPVMITYEGAAPTKFCFLSLEEANQTFTVVGNALVKQVVTALTLEHSIHLKHLYSKWADTSKHYANKAIDSDSQQRYLSEFNHYTVCSEVIEQAIKHFEGTDNV